MASQRRQRPPARGDLPPVCAWDRQAWQTLQRALTAFPPAQRQGSAGNLHAHTTGMRAYRLLTAAERRWYPHAVAALEAHFHLDIHAPEAVRMRIDLAAITLLQLLRAMTADAWHMAVRLDEQLRRYLGAVEAWAQGTPDMRRLAEALEESENDDEAS